MSTEYNRLLDEYVELLDMAYKENFKLVKANEELLKYQEALEAAFVGSVRSFLNLLELKDPWFGGHSKRVAALSTKIGARMGIRDREARDLECAALLHDVGLVGVPDDLIKRQTDSLSESEKKLLRQHPALGQAALGENLRLKDACLIIRWHHESFDGGGYPDGLCGKRIPVGARIIAVAEDFDTFLTAPGRRQNDKEKIMDMMGGMSGSKYDPEVWDAFVEEVSRIEFAGNPTGERAVSVYSLKDGFVLTRDLRTGKGIFLAPRGTALTEVMINKIKNFNRIDPIIDHIFVKGPAARALQPKPPAASAAS